MKEFQAGEKYRHGAERTIYVVVAINGERPTLYQDIDWEAVEMAEKNFLEENWGCGCFLAPQIKPKVFESCELPEGWTHVPKNP